MPKKLLLADDSLTIQKVIGITFANEDFVLTTVDNGVDAIATAKRIKPDLVLADVMMPGKNGYEVCEYVKHDPELRDTPVLLLAGTFESFDEAEMLRVGADGYITKPFESQTLIDKVHELISRAGSSQEGAVAQDPPPPAPEEEFNLEDFSPFEEVAAPSVEASAAAGREGEKGSADEEVWDLSDFEPAAATAAQAEGADAAEVGGAFDAEPVLAGDPSGWSDPAVLEDEPVMLAEEPAAAAGAAIEGEQTFDFGEPDDQPAGGDAAGLDLSAAEESAVTIEGEQTFEPAELAIDPSAAPAAEAAEEPAFDDGVTGEFDPSAAPAAEAGAAEATGETDDVLELTEFEEVTGPDAATGDPLAAADLLPEPEESADTALVQPEAADGWEVAAMAEVHPGGRGGPAAAPAAAGAGGAMGALTARIRAAAEGLVGDPGGAVSGLGGLPREQVEAIVARVAREVIEAVAWEVVPDLCEALIKQEIRRITGSK